jgi:hypothetical protein
MRFPLLPLLAVVAVLMAACSDSKSYEVGVVKTLMVTSVTPGGADNVPLDTEIAIRFSDDVVESTLNADTVILADADGKALEVSYTYDSAAKELVLKPAKPLAYTADYLLTVTQKIKRKSDQAVLAREVDYTFKTIDPPMLAVTLTEPSAMAVHIGEFADALGKLDPWGDRALVEVKVHFNDGIDTATVTADSFVLADDKGAQIAGKFSWESSNSKAVDLLGNQVSSDDILTFKPDSPLKLSTKYTVTLRSTYEGIRSKRATAEGGFFESDVTWSFTTIDPPPLLLAVLSPAATYPGSPPADNIARDTVFTLEFSEDLPYTAVEIAGYVWLENWGVPVPATYSVNGTTVTMTPVSPLKFSERYEVAVMGGKTGLNSWRATKVSGWLIPARTNRFTFKTLDPKVLSIWATSPSDQEESYGVNVSDVAVDGSNLQILFDQHIDHATFASNVKIERCGDATCTSVIPLAIANISYVGYADAEKAVLNVGQLNYDTFYMITVTGGTAGVRTLENTTLCAAVCEGGYMPESYTIRFGTRSIPPLKVNIISPANNAQQVVLRPAIVVDFSFPVDTLTLTPAAFYVTDVTANQLVQRFATNPADAYYASNETATINLLANLAPDHEFNVVIIGTVRGTDGRAMIGDAKFAFHTQRASILRTTDPYNGETGVEVTLANRDVAGKMSVYFDGIVTTPVSKPAASQLSVTYVTAKGVVLLQGAVSVVTTTTTTWRFTPDAACTPLGDPLEANATYYLNVGSQVWRTSDGARLTGGHRAVFHTVNTSPVVANVTAANKVPGRADLVIDMDANTDSIGGAARDDVPVTATYKVEFDRLIDTATLTASAVANPAADTLLVKKQDGTYANLASLATTTEDGHTVVTFAANDTVNNVVAPDLEYDRDYTLLVRTGVREAYPNHTPMVAAYALKFHTSKAPVAYLLPLAADTNPKGQQYAPSVTFNVAVAVESLADSNFYVIQQSTGSNCAAASISVPIPALIDVGYDGRGAAVIPAPLMEATERFTATLAVGAAGPRDVRGNPFPGSPLGTAFGKTYCTNSSDNGTSTVAVASHVPVMAGAVAGRGPVKLNLTVSATLADVLPTTINQNSFWLFYDAGYTKPVTGAASFSQDGQYAAVFVPASGVYFETGKTYYVRNNAFLASAVRNPCDATCVNYTLVGENARPSVVLRTPGGAGSGAALGPVTVTFNEGMRPETITPNTAGYLTVTDTGGIVPGTWTLSASGLVATFVPANAMQSGVTYTINVGAGVKDLAGNVVNAVAGQTFTVEAVRPTISSIVPADTATGVALGADVVVTFSEPMDVAAFTASLIGPLGVYPGAMRLVTAGDPLNPANTANPSAEVMACIAVAGNVVTFSPIDPFTNLQWYSLGVSTTVTDLAGNGLLTGSLTTFQAQ